VKQNDAMMGVDGQGKTPLGKIFSKVKNALPTDEQILANAGTTEGALAGWIRRKQQAESLSKQANDYSKRLKDGGSGTNALAAKAHDQAADALRGVAFDALTIPNLQAAVPFRKKLSDEAKEHEYAADDHRHADAYANLPKAGTEPTMDERFAASAKHHPDHPPITAVQSGWHYDPTDETYSAEKSTLEGSGAHHDPWGRPLLMRFLKQHGDDEGDVTHWSGTVLAPPSKFGTLGKAAKIHIFND